MRSVMVLKAHAIRNGNHIPKRTSIYVVGCLYKAGGPHQKEFIAPTIQSPSLAALLYVSPIDNNRDITRVLYI